MILQIPVGDMQNFAYVILCDDTKQCAYIDPAWEEDKLYQASKGYKLTKLIATHKHFDHTEAIGRIIEDYPDVEVIAHAEDALEIKAAKAIEGNSILVGNIKLEVIHTPGHTKGSVCFLIGNQLITGDTLFIDGCGRVDFQGSSARQMFESLHRITKLDPDIIILPGHDYGNVKTATLKEQIRTNNYLKPKSYEEFYAIRGGTP